MDLERLNIEVRPRNHFQALDLGVLLAKRWYLPLLALFAFPMLAVTLIALPFLGSYPWVVLIFVWWFKPAYERLPLHFLSRAIFGEGPPLKVVAADWRRAVLPGMFGALTIRRLSPRRSFDAPVWILEGVTGKPLNARLHVLGGRASGAAFWLTVIGIHVESFLALGLMTGLWVFLPGDGIESAQSFFGQEFDWQQWLWCAGSLLCMAVVAPFYVACGFSLYLNRRAELEAWDVEVGFRRLASRVAGCLLVGVLAGTITSSDAHAELDERTVASKENIEAVLADDVFTTKETVSYPQFILDWFEFEDEEEQPGFDLAGLFKVLASIGEVAMWLGLGVLLIWIAVKLRLLEWLDQSRSSPDAAPLPSRMFGVSFTEEPLPEDVLGTAQQRWASMDARGALSLLVRSALTTLVERDGCRFRNGDTEGDCLAEVTRRSDQQTLETFSELIDSWRLVAYAHRPLDESQFAELCRAWADTWQARES